MRLEAVHAHCVGMASEVQCEVFRGAGQHTVCASEGRGQCGADGPSSDVDEFCRGQLAG